MKFEHYEGASPAEQFDRLGNKEDAKSPWERHKTLADSVDAARAKVAELEKEIILMAEEDSKHPGESIEEKNLELKDAQAELGSLLKELNYFNDSLDKEKRPVKARIDSEIFNN